MNTDADWKAKADRFVQELKDKASMVEVIGAVSGFHFGGRKGRFVYCQEHESLAVDDDWGQYTWFSKAGQVGHEWETGDVFNYLERYANMDFWQACLWLAERYGVEVPKGMKGDEQARKDVKSRGQVFEIAARWFEAQLWATPAALEYARGRGWSDETIKKARLGYSGGTWETVKDLAGEFSLNEVNCDDPAAVSLIGRRGNVLQWLKTQGIENGKESWVENDSIVGLATFPRLVYPHIWRGRVNYFTGRNLQWEGGKLVGQDAPKEGKPKAHNLDEILAGKKLRYFNTEFHRGAEKCFVVEGQADAITLAQWGFPAVALLGLAADEALGQLIKNMKIETIYVGLDDDEAGQEALMKTAGMFGPMARIYQWPKPIEVKKQSVIAEISSNEASNVEK